MIAGIGMGIALFPETGARFGVAFGGILNPQEDANASWRMEGWQLHLDRLRQGGNLLLGEGLGIIMAVTPTVASSHFPTAPT